MHATFLSVCCSRFYKSYFTEIQKIALCWFIKKSTVQRTSIVRGKCSSPASAASRATTGSATSCYISWPRMVCTSWGLTCRRWTVSSGTGPSTAGSSWTARRPSTGWRSAATRATPETQWQFTTGWSSLHSTEIMMKRISIVPKSEVVVSGGRNVETVSLQHVWRVSVATAGRHFLKPTKSSRQAAAGSCAFNRAFARARRYFFVCLMHECRICVITETDKMATEHLTK